MEDDRVEWNLGQSLKVYLDDPKAVLCGDADASLLEHDDFDKLSVNDINRALDPLVDALAIDASAILRSSIVDTLQLLLKYVLYNLRYSALLMVAVHQKLCRPSHTVCCQSR